MNVSFSTAQWSVFTLRSSCESLGLHHLHSRLAENLNFKLVKSPTGLCKGMIAAAWALNAIHRRLMSTWTSSYFIYCQELQGFVDTEDDSNMQVWLQVAAWLTTPQIQRMCIFRCSWDCPHLWMDSYSFWFTNLLELVFTLCYDEYWTVQFLQQLLFDQSKIKTIQPSPTTSGHLKRGRNMRSKG